MWRLLSDEKLLEAYRKEFLEAEVSEDIEMLLRELALSDLAPHIYAVTSLGVLRLTTASSFSEEVSHGAVAVRNQQSRFVVSLIDGSKWRTADSRICDRRELVGIVQELVRKLPMLSM